MSELYKPRRVKPAEFFVPSAELGREIPPETAEDMRKLAEFVRYKSSLKEEKLAWEAVAWVSEDYRITEDRNYHPDNLYLNYRAQDLGTDTEEWFGTLEEAQAWCQKREDEALGRMP